MSPKDFDSIVVLTGAGISAESGISTFRDADGLWENHRMEDVATPEAFLKNPELVQRFYNLRRAQLDEVQPNAAHLALARFEENYQGKYLLVTQNVDDLHQRSGSRNIIAMHGELRKGRCIRCADIRVLEASIEVDSLCLACGSNDSLRPHIVWFGEVPLFMDRIYSALSSCDLIVVIGTSCSVYPAAGFVAEVPSDCKKVFLNREAGECDNFFDLCRYGPATELVGEFFA